MTTDQEKHDLTVAELRRIVHAFTKQLEFTIEKLSGEEIEVDIALVTEFTNYSLIATLQVEQIVQTARLATTVENL